MRRLLPPVAAALLVATPACAARTTHAPAAHAAHAAPAAGPVDDVVRLARIVRLMELNRQRVALEVELASLSLRYGENHPEMVRVRRQIGVVDTALTREGASDEARLKQEAESAEAQTELALIYIRDGRHDEAERALNRALALIKARTLRR